MTEDPGGLQPKGHKESAMTEQINILHHYHSHFEFFLSCTGVWQIYRCLIQISATVIRLHIATLNLAQFGCNARRLP